MPLSQMPEIDQNVYQNIERKIKTVKSKKGVGQKEISSLMIEVNFDFARCQKKVMFDEFLKRRAEPWGKLYGGLLKT